MLRSSVRFLARLSFCALLLINACAAAPGEKLRPPGPRLSDPEFFARLDLSLPQLAGVKTAVAATNWPAARHAFAEYLRHRSFPKWDFDPFAVGQHPQVKEKEADNALAHRFNSLGIEWQFGPQIDWHFNPTTQPGSKWPRNHEWTWNFNRHAYWVTLARAYYATGDEQYAREFSAELASWVHDCPVPMDAVQNVPFSAWRTIEAGIRSGSEWPLIFPRLLAAKSFDDDSVVLMLKSFVDHADYLLRFHTQGNWFTMECNGLYHVGALFPEFKDAKLWRDTAANRLDAELSIQVYPDGAQIELTPGYHELAMRNFCGPLLLTASTGFELPADYSRKLEKMFTYLLHSMSPLHTMPPLNDSGYPSVANPMKLAHQLFPDEGEFLWFISNGEQGSAPSQTSYFFPYAGQSFLRSGWDTNALWACMDGGPFGTAHQHEDKTSVILTAYGQPLLVEGGTYTYDASEWRTYVLSSRAHNVVMVDGLGQDRHHEPRSTFHVNEPLPHVWESNAAFDHAACRYDEGWGNKSHPLVQTRHLFFIKPGFYVIADELKSLDGKPHTCEALFHLKATNATITNLTVTTVNPGPNLAITAFGADSVTVVKGQTKPVVQGWLPNYSKYGGIDPIPTALFAKRVTDRSTVLYLLYPSPAGHSTSAPVTDLHITRDTLTIKFSHGPDQVIHFQPFPES